VADEAVLKKVRLKKSPKIPLKRKKEKKKTILQHF
jgi:hypothetical protein